MTDNYHFVVKAKRKASSLAHYSIRAKLDTCLHNDVDNFLAKHDTRISRLVDMLLNNEFAQTRYYDPAYPFRK